jgi:ABC-type uncharacterized transport system permease subunit
MQINSLRNKILFIIYALMITIRAITDPTNFALDFFKAAITNIVSTRETCLERFTVLMFIGLALFVSITPATT